MRDKMVNMIQAQIGKKGLTQEFIDNLKKTAKDVENIRVSVLKSACRDKKELIEIKNNLLKGLGKNYTARVIGYTIILKKWRKAR
jgi:RNA-binding protein YhbY